MVASPEILCIAVFLVDRLGDNNDLATGFHPFILGHHTEAVREDLNAYGEHYNLVTEWKGTTVAAAEKMTIPDSVDLPTTLSMTQGILLHT